MLAEGYGDDVGAESQRLADGRCAVFRLADDVDARFRSEQGDETNAHERVIVDD